MTQKQGRNKDLKNLSAVYSDESDHLEPTSCVSPCSSRSSGDRGRTVSEHTDLQDKTNDSKRAQKSVKAQVKHREENKLDKADEFQLTEKSDKTNKDLQDKTGNGSEQVKDCSETDETGKKSTGQKRKSEEKSCEKKRKKKKKDKKKALKKNKNIYPGENFIYNKESPNAVKVHASYEVYTIQNVIEKSLAAKSPTIGARMLLDDIYTSEALQGSSAYGFPPRGKGSSHYTQKDVLPRLDPAGLSAICARILEHQKDYKPWRPKATEKELRASLTNKVCLAKKSVELPSDTGTDSSSSSADSEY